ncbi:MAG: hypothetical protein PHN59_01185 [Candidatus Omnitrophica bacterium]|nr:hypothetical protein [Candidatus Omnitrophota bacterium]
MNKKYLCFVFLVLLASISIGCFPITNAYKSAHITQASLSWYVYLSDNDAESNVPKKEYQKKIAAYLEAYPQTSKEVAEKMKECLVVLGMTEQEVLAMAEPQYVLKGKNKNEKVFKYSNVGKISAGKFIGEGTKIWVTLANGIVTDISQVDLLIGY